MQSSPSVRSIDHYLSVPKDNFEDEGSNMSANDDGRMGVQMTLGDLIAAFEPLVRGDLPVRYDFVDFYPTKLAAWNGADNEISLNYQAGERPLSVSTFLHFLKKAVGMEIKDRDGFYFTVEKSTPVWVANSHNVGQTAILDVLDNEEEVILVTGFCTH